MLSGVATISPPGIAAESFAAPLVERQPAGRLREFVIGPENALARRAIEGLLAAVLPKNTVLPTNIAPLNSGASTDAPAIALFPSDAPEGFAEFPGEPRAFYNPLSLVGRTGLGKTHLVDLLRQAWVEHYPPQRVVVLEASDLAREYADAVKLGTLDVWRRELRQSALLVIEQLHTLVERTAVQIELINTIDALIDSGGQIVVTSRVGWDDHDWLPALVGRLQGGLVVQLQPPEADTRRELLLRWVQQRRSPIAPGAIRVLAEGLNLTAGELIGGLLKLEHAALAERRTVDVAAARAYVAHVKHSRMPTVRNIAIESAKQFGLTLAELKSPTRRAAVVAARGAATYLAREMAELSFEQIGAFFGGRDHTTVLHAFRKVEAALKNDPALRQIIADIRQAVSRT